MDHYSDENNNYIGICMKISYKEISGASTPIDELAQYSDNKHQIMHIINIIF